MNLKEAEIVTEEFISKNNTYNLCSGGKGGFSYINRNGLGVSENQKEASRKFAYRNLEKINAPENIDLKREAMDNVRSEEHTSELQSLMRISYAVFCLKK